MVVLNSLIPIFLIIALGVALGRFGFLDQPLVHGLNRIAYWIALPALLVHSIATAPLAGDRTLVMSLAVYLATLLVLGVAYAMARILAISKARTGTFVQAAFRGNLAYIAIPIVVYLASSLPEEEAAGLVALSVLVLATTMVLYNIAGVAVLQSSNGSSAKQGIRQYMVALIRNPLLLASAAGISLNFLGQPVPEAVMLGIRTTGQMTIPIGLLCIGYALVSTRISGQLGTIAAAALLKTGLSPLLGIPLALLFGLSPLETKVFLVILACPTAVASYLMASQMGGDAGLASGSIAFSTLLSSISLALVLALA